MAIDDEIELRTMSRTWPKPENWNYRAKYEVRLQVFRELIDYPERKFQYRTPLITSIAKEIYDNQLCGSDCLKWLCTKCGGMGLKRLTLDYTGILADAIEDAGCNDKALITHLRKPGHLRGCWAIDLILGLTCVPRRG